MLAQSEYWEDDVRFTVTLEDWEPPGPVQLNVKVVLLLKGTLTSDPLVTDLLPDQGPPAVPGDLTAAAVDWDEVTELMEGSYRQVALKRMLQAMEQQA